MAWLQYRLETSAELAPHCEDELLALGAATITLEDNADQPLFDLGEEEKQLWNATRVSGLFPVNTNTDQLWLSLSDVVQEQCTARAEILEDKDWEREWMQHYQPTRYAQGLWICPSWLQPPEPDAVNIMLDPGLAFGTGTHPTTAMCLQLLAELDLQHRDVTDFGCGSGVLGIGALLLGAKHVLGVDTDPQALIATRANCERNSLPDSRCSVKLPSQLSGQEQADIVLANILAGPLGELASTLCSQLRPNGTLVLSGILAEQVPALRKCYPFELDVALEREGWVALIGHKP